MENELKTISLKQKINVFFQTLQIEVAAIISSHFGVNYDNKSIKQFLPNKFRISNLIFEYSLESWHTKKNSLNITFPPITADSQKIYINRIRNKNNQFIYHKLLDEKFNQESLFDDLIHCFYIFCKNYSSLVYQIFSDIRSDFFHNIDRELFEYESALFNKPHVLIKCEVSETISSYGYKPGEGRNYIHSYSVHYSDIHKFKNKNLKEYLNSLNASNPKQSDEESYEINASNYLPFLQIEYFDFQLSERINHYIRVNKERYVSLEFEDIKHKPIIKKDRKNFEVFEHIILIYVITQYNIDKIESFFSHTKLTKDETYENLVLISQFFLNNKFSSSNFVSDYYKFRNTIIIQLWNNNFKGRDSYDLIINSFELINGNKEDLKLLRYFYINFLMSKRLIDYDEFTFIIYKFFSARETAVF